MFYLTNVCLIMDHFNPVENPTQAANVCLTTPDHGPRVLNPHKERGVENFKKYEMMIAFLDSTQKSSFHYKIAGGNTIKSRYKVFLFQ